MLVKDICCKNVVTIDATDTIRKAAETMARQNVGSLIVLNENGTPHGILTDRDIATSVVANRLDADQTTVHDVMAHPVVSIRDTANIEMALDCMTFGVRRIPVVDEHDRLVGVVSLDDFLTMYSEGLDQVRRVLQKEMATS